MNKKENGKTIPNRPYQGEGVGVTNDLHYVEEYKTEIKQTPIPPKQPHVVSSGYGVIK